MTLTHQQLLDQALPDLEEALAALRRAARQVDKARKEPEVRPTHLEWALKETATAIHRMTQAIHYARLAEGKP